MTIKEMRQERVDQGRLFAYLVAFIVILTICALIGAVWLTPLAVENRQRLEERGWQEEAARQQYREAVEECDRTPGCNEDWLAKKLGLVDTPPPPPTQPVSTTGDKK